MRFLRKFRPLCTSLPRETCKRGRVTFTDDGIMNWAMNGHHLTYNTTRSEHGSQIAKCAIFVAVSDYIGNTYNLFVQNCLSFTRIICLYPLLEENALFILFSSISYLPPFRLHLLGMAAVWTWCCETIPHLRVWSQHQRPTGILCRR